MDEEERVECQELGEGFYKVMAHYGFMESPDVPAVLARSWAGGADGRPVAIKAMETSFYLGRETLIVSRNTPPTAPVPEAIGRMSMWRKRLFVAHDQERALGHRLLRSPAEPRRRARRADPVLAPPSPRRPLQ